MTNLEKVARIIADTHLYIQENSEGIRISSRDTDLYGFDDIITTTDGFDGIGEDSGESYRIFYSEVDLDNDMFYTLTVLDTNKY